MSGELDLRSVHRHHDPDPTFVRTLERRLGAVIDASATDDAATSIDGVAAGSHRNRNNRQTRPRGRMRLLVVAAAAAVVVIAGAVAVVALRHDDPATDVATGKDDGPVATSLDNWVAFDSDGTGGDDIYLVRSGEPPRRVIIPGSEAADEVCPAFAPDGDRLMFGRPTGGGGELVIVPVADDGSVSPAQAITIDGMAGTPCAIWAPDGRWVAFGGTGSVWLVDTASGEVRQLPGRDPSDLEWRPGTDELAIAGRVPVNQVSDSPIEIYSVSTGEIRTVGDARAAHITWSPDGSTIAYTHGEDQPASGIWLVDVDGSNERQLVVATDEVMHGIGVVWSPRGDWIAYQEVCERLPAVRFEEEHPDEDITDLVPYAPCREEHEVVLLRAGTGDPENPIGTRRVIPPPQTETDGRPQWWFPTSVTWSPDGEHLLYTAWNDGLGGVLVVPVDDAEPPVVLTEDIGPAAYDGTPWVPLQQWRRS